jgi:hypothetical protein
VLDERELEELVKMKLNFEEGVNFGRVVDEEFASLGLLLKEAVLSAWELE